MNFSCWKCADDGWSGTMVSLLGLLYMYVSLQRPLDNRKNKNLRNVCLTQIRENIFLRKFLLIQYILGVYLKCLKIIKNFKTGYRDDYLTKTALICLQFKEKFKILI